MSIEPPLGLVPPEPRQQFTPPPPPPVAPPRRLRRSTLAIIASGAALMLVGAGLLGHGVWQLADSANSRSAEVELGRPGHALPLPQVAADNDLDVTAATPVETIGVVTILTDLYYDGIAQAAGSGSVLTSDGTVLTNNHVIEGSTSIEVTIESTGENFSAVVLGTDKTKDVALLQLQDRRGEKPTGLDTVELNYDEPEIGDEVRSIGNALGTGDLVTATGAVVSLGESLSISDGYGAAYENLDNLIEVDADVVSGDSGGPLVDVAGDVIGMVTAASTASKNIRGYAITTADAMAVVKQILDGDESGTVNIGPTAFIGVLLDEKQGPDGVTLSGTVDDTPADKAGLVDGDTITHFAGVPVFTVEELKAEVAKFEPGDEVEISIIDANGNPQTLLLTLAEGPA
jgi:S1-C subfamily serine protease